MRRIGAFAIFHHVDSRFCDVNFVKARLRNVVDLQAVAKVADWINACHNVSLSLCLGGVLEDAEHDELSRSNRSDTDLADQPSVEDVVLSHRGSVAGDVERLLFCLTHEGSQAPLRAQK